MKAKRANIDKVIEGIMKRKRKALAIAGAVVQNDARMLCNVGKYPAGSGKVGGALRQSIYSVVEGDSAYIGSNMVYAAMQEFGGVVTPVKASALTIPIAPEAVGRRAADFDGLFILKKNGKAFLAKKDGEGIKIYYILLESVEIPKSPYLRPALETNKIRVKQILQQA